MTRDMERESIISQLYDKDRIFDFVVIGGGATGLGVALDAVTRGYSVALFERSDLRRELPAGVRNWYMEVSVIWRRAILLWFVKRFVNGACSGIMLRIW